MSINSLDGVPLPDGLVWTDEFANAAVAQSVKRALDGSLVVFYGGIQSGTQITLTSEPDAGWFTREQVEAIELRARSPGAMYPLTLRGQSSLVMFRHHEAPAFEATPLISRPNPAPGDFYLGTLKLMTL
jgi:hypothetical protein